MICDIERLEYAITNRMNRITQYNNKLKEIALRPEPLSTVQYLDMMIEGEKREKKSGLELFLFQGFLTGHLVNFLLFRIFFLPFSRNQLYEVCSVIVFCPVAV
jgi:hypothetical protein